MSNPTQARGPFIITQSGRRFPFYTYTEEDLDIEDIAHALSMLCRFTGHTDLFYSVASHSLMVSNHVGGGPELQLAALLHDAAEAYMGDMSSPLKRIVGNHYTEPHDTLLMDILRRFGVDRPCLVLEPTIREADQIASAYEAHVLLGLGIKELVKYQFVPEGFEWPWGLPSVVDRVGGQFSPLYADTPGASCTEFLDRYRKLRRAVGWLRSRAASQSSEGAP